MEDVFRKVLVGFGVPTKARHPSDIGETSGETQCRMTHVRVI